MDEAPSAQRRRPATAAAAATSTTAATTTTATSTATDDNQINWTTMPLSVLHEYRHVHNLPCPSAFSSPINAILLSQGRALRSPTALARQKDAGRVSKAQLAAAVRKHFNNTAVSEQDAIARFLYKVSEERRGKEFRLRFSP